MKTLKKVVLTFSFLLLACIVAKAELPARIDKNVTGILLKYIESTTMGKNYDFTELLTDDFVQYTGCKERLLNCDKEQFIATLKLQKDYEMNCVTDYSLMEEKENFVIAKVDMKFPTFTKTNYITMSDTGEGWKITSISIHYE